MYFTNKVEFTEEICKTVELTLPVKKKSLNLSANCIPQYYSTLLNYNTLHKYKTVQKYNTLHNYNTFHKYNTLYK